MTFKDLTNEDISFETKNGKRYRYEIEHFKETSELYISLFSNSKRINRDKSKVDYVQLIAIKIFQDTRAALLLALKGLFPQASSLLRGAIESYYLVYDFKINPNFEDFWFNGSKTQRKKLFKLSAVRQRVKEACVTETGSLNGLYHLLSQISVHVNMESHLWYLELRDKKLFYHWAGFDSVNKSDALINSCLQSLAQGLFIFTYEGFYALDKNWSADFTVWKKQHLIFVKKLARTFSIEGYEYLDLKEDKIEIVNPQIKIVK